MSCADKSETTLISKIAPFSNASPPPEFTLKLVDESASVFMIIEEPFSTVRSAAFKTSNSAPFSRVNAAPPEIAATSLIFALIISPPSESGVYLRIEKLSSEEIMEKFSIRPSAIIVFFVIASASAELR